MKAKTTLYLRAETVQALADYLERHVSHLRSKSDAADYLLRVALDNADCRETTQGFTAAAYDDLATLLDRHFNQLVALLQQNGKDAHRAAQMAEALSAQLLNDTYETARLAEEARLHATARYTRRDLFNANTPQ